MVAPRAENCKGPGWLWLLRAILLAWRRCEPAAGRDCASAWLTIDRASAGRPAVQLIEREGDTRHCDAPLQDPDQPVAEPPGPVLLHAPRRARWLPAWSAAARVTLRPGRVRLHPDRPSFRGYSSFRESSTATGSSRRSPQSCIRRDSSLISGTKSGYRKRSFFSAGSAVMS